MSAAKWQFVLEVGGLSRKSARGVHQTQTSEGDVMKTLIRVVKRGSEDSKNDTAAAPPAKPRLTTEMIIKSWIIESRERRRAELHNGVRRLGA